MVSFVTLLCYTSRLERMLFMPIKKYVIGVDLGGTKIFTALADQKGRILSEIVLSTDASKGQVFVINIIKQSIVQVLESAGKTISQIKAIGIGAPGPVLSKQGVIVNPPNLPGWKAVPLAGILRKAFKVPVYLENDANAAAVGEMKFGAAQGAKNFLYVTVSTGIGGGIVIDGKVYGGSNGSAGEIGHTIIEPTGEMCGCGRRGCFEIMASGRALVRYGKEFLGKELQPIEIEQLAKKGDPGALKAIDRLAYYLAIGLGNQINTLSPELLVIGGGLSYELFKRICTSRKFKRM
ncbi:MAG: ROK family protein [Candidatus Saganbacteria bacterium]|nr:ROK family protein [Candidatus Saganbacteria bacterium]